MKSELELDVYNNGSKIALTKRGRRSFVGYVSYAAASLIALVVVWISTSRYSNASSSETVIHNFEWCNNAFWIGVAAYFLFTKIASFVVPHYEDERVVFRNVPASIVELVKNVSTGRSRSKDRHENDDLVPDVAKLLALWELEGETSRVIENTKKIKAELMSRNEIEMRKKATDRQNTLNKIVSKI